MIKENCIDCGIEFIKLGNLKRCENCAKNRIKNWYIKNKEYVIQRRKIYYEQIKERHKIYGKIYYQKIKIEGRQKKYLKNKIQTNINFKLRINLSQRISVAIKNHYGKKAYKTIDLLGCPIDKCKEHLEKKFKKGMTWKNHGKYGWHIDHIKPCANFDLSKEEEQKKCFHYTNLQPLWWQENIKKSNKVIDV